MKLDRVQLKKIHQALLKQGKIKFDLKIFMCGEIMDPLSKHIKEALTVLSSVVNPLH